jgi:hypothetical protein
MPDMALAMVPQALFPVTVVPADVTVPGPSQRSLRGEGRTLGAGTSDKER